MTMSTPRPPASLTVAPLPVGDPVSDGLLREFLIDVADRWYQLHEGRDTTPEEIDRHLVEMPSDDLTPPHGMFLVAQHDGEPAGCAGVRLLDGGSTAELKRVFVRPAKRGLGVGAVLLAAAEAAARELGAERAVLETRLDLREARALYARYGYVDVPPFREGPYTEVWLGKDLGAPAAN
ncbi:MULTISPECIES: GNAT family N-acetyltransferase [unclassified Streptomyces]|uniref:GNAT family N-acetyltransferase n=1 Tax=unclassified Streptomyces TaxID=2593676 RepID=UPI003369DE13